MIKEKEVKCVMKKLYCDKCGTEMQTNGFVFTVCPPLYSYKCPQCGYKETTSDNYPHIVYVEIEEENQ